MQQAKIVIRIQVFIDIKRINFIRGERGGGSKRVQEVMLMSSTLYYLEPAKVA